MSRVKLSRLPERTPIRISVHLLPDLHIRLEQYAVAYEESYGEKIAVAELIPAIIDAFLQSDRDFSRRPKV
ncbi:DUF2274 domain-containing protein [Novosphingobium sp.]|jgi:hypothetical protein|uniref:DUF2274 domain-containing protein n=1 Tax=Novosphingobium sp. TaxID=1874826 RepID=UPI002FE2AFD8